MWPSAPRTRRAACMSINAVDHSTRSALSPSARTGSPHTITRAAKTTPENESQSTDTEEDEQGTAQEQGVTMREIVQRMGPLRLGVLSAVVFCLLSRAVSGAMASGMQLPGALAGSWAVQEILLSEILFFVSSKVYLDGISDRYAGHAPWSLPLPIPPSAESFINAVLFTGVVVPLVLSVVCASVGVAPMVLMGAFGPYVLGLCIQLFAWRTMGFRNSVAWPLVPIPFTAWRLAQLARTLQWLTLSNAPTLVTCIISYVLIPSWAMILLGHLFMLPMLYRWPLRDDSLITSIGPLPVKPRQVEEDEGARVLDQVAELTVQAQKLRVRAALLRKMQTGRG